MEFLDRLSKGQLMKEGMCEVNTNSIEKILGRQRMGEVHRFSDENSKYFVSRTHRMSFLAWRMDPLADYSETLDQFVAQYKTHRDKFGPIRNQRSHGLSWAYVVADMLAAMSKERGWSDEFVVLSVLAIAFMCQQGEMVRFGGANKYGEDHACYAFSVRQALDFIKKHDSFRIPKETDESFNCSSMPAFSLTADDYAPRIRYVHTFQGLPELFSFLRAKPVAADLIVFDNLWNQTGVYRGPLTPQAEFVGYHEVIIETLAIEEGELVAICRMSNGLEAANEGYAFVSLCTRYVLLLQEGQQVRPTPSPMSLLTNFTVLDMFDARNSQASNASRGASQATNEEEDSVTRMRAAEEALAAKKKEEPSFELSGKLAEETYSGVTFLFTEPPEAKKPSERWILNVFKDGEPLDEPLYLDRQSCYLFGRDETIADIPTDHPSCSKQHAVIQYREVEKEKADGMMGKQVSPIEPQRYYELFGKDTIKFGDSSREYVLLHEDSAA